MAEGGWSAWPIHVSAVLNSVDHDDVVMFEDLIDDAVVASSSRSETLEFTHEWFPETQRILGKRSEDGSEGGVADLVGELVEVAKTLRRDLDLVHRVGSDLIAETNPLALGSLSS